MTEMSVIEPVTGEDSNLALHTELCAQRYTQLINKFDEVDGRLDYIQTVLDEIHTNTTAMRENTAHTYLRWAGVIIMVLVGIVVHFVVQ
tara:strand:+ start:187 stop:453 length:267 start_codon:yes stop_codon:yes gene_type:complete